MAVNVSQMSLNAVSTVAATVEPGVFILYCNITDMEGNTYDAEYCSRSDDTFGLNPTIRQWLAENPSFQVQPYAPPTVEEIRASLPPLSARQLRLGLVNAGISSSQITAAIDSMPAGANKDRAQIEWEYATTFDRMHPLLATVGVALGFAEEHIDAVWAAAADL
jgi:hypothetical protein